MKKLFYAILVLIISLTTLSAQNKSTNKNSNNNELPKSAQTFITKHYPKDKITLSKAERDGSSMEYKVVLSSGTEIEFDSKGDWTEIECKRTSSIPTAIVPAKVTKYVKTKFSSYNIIKIEQDKKGTDIKLNNGYELEFDKKGDFLKLER